MGGVAVAIKDIGEQAIGAGPGWGFEGGLVLVWLSDQAGQLAGTDSVSPPILSSVLSSMTSQE